MSGYHRKIIMNIFYRNHLPASVLMTAAVLFFILIESSSFAYIRQHSHNAGFNHHQNVHVMHYYNHALGDTDTLNIVLMYLHWPILKVEGLVTNRNVSMLHRYQYIEVHQRQAYPKQLTRSP